MNLSTRKNVAAFAAAVLLVVELTGCGGTLVVNPPVPMGTAVDLSGMTHGYFAEAGTIRISAGQSRAHGDITFTCSAGGVNCTVTVAVSDDGMIAVTSVGIVTAADSDRYIERSTDFSVSNVIWRSTGSRPVHSDTPYGSNTVQLPGSGSDYLGLTQSHNSGRYSYHDQFSYRTDRHAYAIAWRDTEGDVQFSIGVDGEVPDEDSPGQRQGRSIVTISENLAPVESHDLGGDWRVFEATKDYSGHGTLQVHVVTDVDDADAPGKPWAGYAELDRTIVLDDIPGLSSGHDWQVLEIPEGGAAGSLDGVSGNFSCQGRYCSLQYDRAGNTAGYYPDTGAVVFAPSDGGTEIVLHAAASSPVHRANYLTFGNWLYRPDNFGDGLGYDFGVFAGGDDPFDFANTLILQGSATYAGDATGMYYAFYYSRNAPTANEVASVPNPSASSSPAGVAVGPFSAHLYSSIAPTAIATTFGPAPLTSEPYEGVVVGSFSADVALTADFGTNLELGTLSGRVHNFQFRDGYPYSPDALKELFLRTAPIADQSTGDGNPVPATEMFAVGLASDREEGPPLGWAGEWRAAFFGNDADDPRAHPTGVAGTFGAAIGDSGLVGAFGAHKQP